MDEKENVTSEDAQVHERKEERERRTEEKDSVENGRSDPQQRPFFPQQQETE